MTKLKDPLTKETFAKIFKKVKISFKLLTNKDLEKIKFSSVATEFNKEQLKIMYKKIDLASPNKKWNDVDLQSFFIGRLKDRCKLPITKENLLHISNLTILIWNIKNEEG